MLLDVNMPYVVVIKKIKYSSIRAIFYNSNNWASVAEVLKSLT